MSLHVSLCCGAHGENCFSRTKTEDCRQKKKKKNESTPRVTHVTHRTHATRNTRNTAAQRWEHIYRNRKERSAEGAGTLDHTRLSTKSALQQQQQQRCTYGNMHVSHNSRNPQLYRSQGPIKKKLILFRKPNQYSADKLPHTRDFASCSAGGPQACIAI